MEKSIKFKVQVKAADLWQFTMYHTNRGLALIFNILFTAAALYLLISKWSVSSGGYRFTMFFCALIFTVWQPLLLFRKAQKQLKQPALKEPMTLEFNEEGLIVNQLDQEVKFEWDQIGRIDKIPTMLIVYMDRVHAYLIPNNLFADKEESLSQLLHDHLPKERLRRI